MTYVIMSLSPSEVEFHHPLSEDLVTKAADYIRDELNSIILDHDDSETRGVDLRRTHAPLSSSEWIIRYKNNKIMVTNQIADNNSRQFEALTSGNGMTSICASHLTRQVSRGWSESDRHLPLYRGGKKRLAGDIGPPYPGFLKYYDKRTGMWMYRHCVRPIRSSIIDDVNRDIRRAVFLGLERARYEMYDSRDKDAGGSNESEDEGMTTPMGEPPSIEELAFTHDSKTKQERDLEDYRVKKLEEEQATMDSQLKEKDKQERAREIIAKAGQEKLEKRGQKFKEKLMKKTGLGDMSEVSRLLENYNQSSVGKKIKKKYSKERLDMKDIPDNQALRDHLEFGVK
jgi:hypothetical protein